eukprot:TRINITY_DN3989_c2_g3_i3.p1 TRINITY_DN3989_c2_g3~~TRINITY_DN3989_c2_g3_i3.p1  ORF type:complete len:989 (+),score=147.06 TRINITY_DN3989_c2_g3_i3:152-3118(+)
MPVPPQGRGAGGGGGGFQASVPATVMQQTVAAKAVIPAPVMSHGAQVPHMPSQLRGTQLQWGRLMAKGVELRVDLLKKWVEDISPQVHWRRPHQPHDLFTYKLTVLTRTSSYTAYSSFPIESGNDSSITHVLISSEDLGFDLVRVLDCQPNHAIQEMMRGVDAWHDCPPWPLVIRLANSDEVSAYKQEHMRAEKWMFEQMQRAVDSRKIAVTAVEFRYDGKELAMIFDAEGSGPDMNELRGAEAKLSELLGVRVKMRRAGEEPPPAALVAAASLPPHQRPTYLPAFRDPSTNNMITFEYSIVNGLRYWVNDSDRPPLQSISLLVRGNGVSLWFVEQDRGITLPRLTSAKIITELTKLANMAEVPHNLPEIPVSRVQYQNHHVQHLHHHHHHGQGHHQGMMPQQNQPQHHHNTMGGMHSPVEMMQQQQQQQQPQQQHVPQQVTKPVQKLMVHGGGGGGGGAPNPAAHPFIPSSMQQSVLERAGHSQTLSDAEVGSPKRQEVGIGSAYSSTTPTPVSSDQQATSPVQEKLQTPCHYFQSGGCSRGDRCRYLHVYPSEQPTNVHIPESMKDAVRRAISYTNDDAKKKDEPVEEPSSKIQLDLDSHAGQIEWLIMNSVSQGPELFEHTFEEFLLIEDEARITIVHQELAEWRRIEYKINEFTSKYKDVITKLQWASPPPALKPVEPPVTHIPQNHVDDPFKSPESHRQSHVAWFGNAGGGGGGGGAPQNHRGVYGQVANGGPAPGPPPAAVGNNSNNKHFSANPQAYRPPPPLIPASSLPSSISSPMTTPTPPQPASPWQNQPGRTSPSAVNSHGQEGKPVFRVVNPHDAQIQAAAARAAQQQQQLGEGGGSVVQGTDIRPPQQYHTHQQGGKGNGGMHKMQTKVPTATQSDGGHWRGDHYGHQGGLIATDNLKDFPKLGKPKVSGNEHYSPQSSDNGGLPWAKDRRSHRGQGGHSQNRKRGKVNEAVEKLKMEKALAKVAESYREKEHPVY